MAVQRFGRRVGAALVVTALVVTALGIPGAAAHHGWSWAEGEQIELRGTIREVYIGQPHPSLRVETGRDGLWTVELGNPRQTADAGFTEGSASLGDEVIAYGHRSRDQGERRMKAVRLRLGERTYDIYPSRIREG
jgi:hypothetical protein